MVTNDRNFLIEYNLHDKLKYINMMYRNVSWSKLSRLFVKK